MSNSDVFVIGGGPAGLAAAIAARQRGFAVTVGDCALPSPDKACGEGIMPDGLVAASALGLDLTSAGGYRFRGIGFREGDISVHAEFRGAGLRPAMPRLFGAFLGSVGRGKECPDESGHSRPDGLRYEYGLGLRRTILHQMMMDRAADLGVRMQWGARVDPGELRARWIIGADGGQSQVRRWAGLDACARDSRRYGFRRHYRIAPWSDHMEIHWGPRCQIYLTPTAAEELCVVVISRDPHLRLDDALPEFPEVMRRLAGAALATPERGAVTATRRLRRVHSGNVALIGDASGSVDAVTGEGLCLLFQQSIALADALAVGDLSQYAADHRRIGRRPEFMADLMLLLDRRHGLRRRVLRAMSARPSLFSQMLAHHVGELNPAEFLANGLALGWQVLTI